MAEKKYKIKIGSDTGFGSFHLYCDGDWLESFTTQELAQAELISRQAFDATMQGRAR